MIRTCMESSTFTGARNSWYLQLRPAKIFNIHTGCAIRCWKAGAFLNITPVRPFCRRFEIIFYLSAFDMSSYFQTKNLGFFCHLFHNNHLFSVVVIHQIWHVTMYMTPSLVLFCTEAILMPDVLPSRCLCHRSFSGRIQHSFFLVIRNMVPPDGKMFSFFSITTLEDVKRKSLHDTGKIFLIRVNIFP